MPSFDVAIADIVTTHPHLGEDPGPIYKVPVGPVGAVAAHGLALAPAVVHCAAHSIYAAHQDSGAGIAGNHNLQAGAQQHIVATDLGLAELDASGLYLVVTKLDHKAGPIGFLAICFFGSQQDKDKHNSSH
jgi:hypothetical protein